MDKINKHNYEAFFLDYSEGNLSVQEIAELELFLIQYPELAVELNDFDNSLHLSEMQKTPFNNSQLLKRNEATGLTEMEMLMIASVEGELTKQEQQELSNFMADAKVEKEALIYQKTKLKADPSIVFFGKEQLKRSNSIYWKPYMNVAAALVTAMVFWFTFPENEARYSTRKVEIGTSSNAHQKDELKLLVESNKTETQTIKNNNLTAQNIRLISIPKSKSVELGKIEMPSPIENNILAENEILEKIAISEEIVDFNEIAELNTETHSSKESYSTPDEYQSVSGFLLQKFNTDVLKNKTFTEVFVEEVSKATQENVEFKRKGENDKNQGFALVFGKFGISHTKSR